MVFGDEKVGLVPEEGEAALGGDPGGWWAGARTFEEDVLCTLAPPAIPRLPVEGGLIGDCRACFRSWCPLDPAVGDLDVLGTAWAWGSGSFSWSDASTFRRRDWTAAGSMRASACRSTRSHKAFSTHTLTVFQRPPLSPHSLTYLKSLADVLDRLIGGERVLVVAGRDAAWPSSALELKQVLLGLGLPLEGRRLQRRELLSIPVGVRG